MALEQTSRSGKAVGTRDRVVAWLALHGDVEDSSGMASTALARSIGYPGSSIAFAQLLSGMERSGLIVRDVRGKRTYRVSLTDAGRARAAAGRDTVRHPVTTRRYTGATPASRRPGALARRGKPEEQAVDYDELARRLLVQVARRLAENGTAGAVTAPTPAELPAESAVGVAEPAVVGGGGREVDALAQRLAVLETELARARAARLALQDENEALRDQIERIRNNLEGSRQRPVRTRVPPPVDEIDHRDVALLQQVLVDRQAGDGRRRDEADSA